MGWGVLLALLASLLSHVDGEKNVVVMSEIERFTELTDDDLAWVAQQLGRKPRGLVRVAKRDDQGMPLVLATAPIRHVRKRVTPYADLYWLACPSRALHLAQLESGGAIRRVESQLHDDAAMMGALTENHRVYVATRRAWGESVVRGDDGPIARPTESAPSVKTADGVELLALLALLDKRGIAGVQCWSSVKCLHAHVAYDLVHGDGVVAELLRRNTAL